jgi:hypothetical protein
MTSQYDIWRLLDSGMRNKEVAKALGCSDQHVAVIKSARKPDDPAMRRYFYAQFIKERAAAMSMIEAMKTTQDGFELWRSKPHNKHWWRLIDGTPIPNDLSVCIAQAIANASRACAIGEAPVAQAVNSDSHPRHGVGDDKSEYGHEG